MHGISLYLVPTAAEEAAIKGLILIQTVFSYRFLFSLLFQIDFAPASVQPIVNAAEATQYLYEHEVKPAVALAAPKGIGSIDDVNDSRRLMI
jgi:hypothetical protein